MEAIKLGSTAIGIATKEGVILAAEKRITSSLIVPQSLQKIMEVDNHIGTVHVQHQLMALLLLMFVVHNL